MLQRSQEGEWAHTLQKEIILPTDSDDDGRRERIFARFGAIYNYKKYYIIFPAQNNSEFVEGPCSSMVQRST